MNQNGLATRVRDTAGLTDDILSRLKDVQTTFYQELVGIVADRAGLSNPRPADVVGRLEETGIELRTADLEDTIANLITETTRESDWGAEVDAFKRNHPNLRLSFQQRSLVINALRRLPIPPNNDPVLLAQVIADVATGAGTDPVQLTRPAGRPLAWDFKPDLFETSRDQIVLEANVRAAGSLMWCYDIGERLGVYRLADALVYRWWVGLVDFGDPNLTNELYRYYKLRDDRPTEEERFLLYRRILNTGAAEVGDRVIVNEEFPGMWRTLMEEVATYIDRSESSFRDRVNRQSVEQAIRELQYNLTERMAGMALTQVTEMYNQIRQTDRGGGALGALDILGHPEVIAQLASGRRRDEWSVIERLAKEEFGVSPNVSALRTSAVDGFRVVDFIASFRPGQFNQDQFDSFIAAAKSWILSQQLAGEGLLVGGSDRETDQEDVEYDELNDAADEFEPWEE